MLSVVTITFQSLPTHVKPAQDIMETCKICSRTQAKQTDAASSYIPISLLCILYKLYERLIYNRIQLIIEPVLPKEQAVLRQNRLDQVAPG